MINLLIVVIIMEMEIVRKEIKGDKGDISTISEERDFHFCLAALVREFVDN